MNELITKILSDYKAGTITSLLSLGASEAVGKAQIVSDSICSPTLNVMAMVPILSMMQALASLIAIIAGIVAIVNGIDTFYQKHYKKHGKNAK